VLAQASKRVGARIVLTPRRAARDSHGVAVDAVHVALSDIAFPPDEQAAVLAFARDGEIACTDRWLLYAQEPARLDALVAWALERPAADGAPAHAVTAQCDLGGVVAAAYALVPQDAPRWSQALAHLPAGEPMTLAGDFARGSARWSIHVPMAPIAALVNAAGIAALEDWLRAP
jgi:hypothetical protein